MIEIFELNSEAEWREAHPCLQTLRPELSLDMFLSRRESLMNRDYHLLALIERGRIVCAAGYVLQPHIERGTEFWLHDFATLPEERSKGHGATMIRHLEEIASENGCKRLVLHTRMGRDRAQNFYVKKAQFEEYALVYKKELS